MKSLFFAGALLIFAAVFAIAALRFGPLGVERPASTEEFPLLSPNGHFIGAQTAPIQMFVYTDLDCLYCRDFHITILPQLLQAYGDDILVVYREFPLPSRPRAYHDAEAAECAYAQGGDTAFWNFVGRMFSVLSPGGTYSATALSDTARTIGLDVRKFEQCLETGQQKGKVDQDIVEGTIVGVTQVPSILFKRGDKKVLVSGNYPAQMRAAITYLLSAP